MSKAVEDDSAAAGFWHSHFGSAVSCTCNELVFALEAYCEERGTPSPPCLPLMVKHCISSDTVNAGEFLSFFAIFAPFESALDTASGSLFDGDRMHSWFHGAISRGEAKALMTGAADGSFLVRRSRQPGKLAIQFLSGGAIKNCLLHNLGGGKGFALSMAPKDAASIFPTVQDFIAYGVANGKFTTPVPSALSDVCNAEAVALAVAAEAAVEAPSNYGAFDPGDGVEAYTDLPAAGGSNYAAFDAGGAEYADLGLPAPAAGGGGAEGNYAAFTEALGAPLEADGADPGAGGGGSYGMFDPTAGGGDDLGLPFPGDVDASAADAGGGSYAMFTPEGDEAVASEYAALPPADSYAVFEG